MTQMIRLGARLRAARKAAGFKTSKDFLKKHKVPASTYSQHESGKRTPDEAMLKFYCKVFGVNLDWLKNGIGQPFLKPTSLQKNIVNEELLDISKQEHLDKISITKLNQKLLVKILDEMLLVHQSKKHKNASLSIAKDTISIYVDIIKKYTNQTEQIQAATNALNWYKTKNRK